LCDVVYSDNAKSFVQGGELLQNALKSEEGKEFFQANQIKHIKIPLYSPWIGAVWERMIRTVKDCLYKAMGRSTLEYFEFITLLSEIEEAVNSRLLTYMSLDNDIAPLNPNAFLKSNHRSQFEFNFDDEADPMWDPNVSSRDNLLNSLKHLQDLYDRYRERWYEEYLLSLRELSRDLYQEEWTNRVKIGDVILIKSPVKPRPYWQMEVVTKLIEGDDGKVRSAFVKTGGHVNKYSIKVLFPLELSITHGCNTQSTLPSDADASDPNTSRPQRAAAIAARKKFTSY